MNAASTELRGVVLGHQSLDFVRKKPVRVAWRYLVFNDLVAFGFGG